MSGGLLALLILAGVMVLGAGVLGVRVALAKAYAVQEDATPRQKMADSGVTETLTILPLYDREIAEPGLLGGLGVSYRIQTDDTTVLLDFGNSHDFSVSSLEQNMARLGVDLADIDQFVLSHNHFDHTGGTRWMLKNTFSPGSQQVDLAGKPIYVPVAMTYPGATPIVAKAPQRLGRGIATLGVVSYAEPFLAAIFFPARGSEQAIAVNVAGVGVVLITGCGHPGVERLVARAQALFDAPVVGIVGGLHYTTASAQDLRPQIAFLQALNPRIVALSPHDSGAAALAAFRQAFPTAYRDIRVGQPIMVGK